MADPATTAFGAIVGICAALVICVIALIVFVIVFCNLKIKNDNNIRKRVMANDAFNEVKTVQEAQPMIQPPAPIVVPAAPRPVTPPAVLPRAQTPPARIVIRERETQPRPSHARSRSWGGGNDDWMLVRKATKATRRRRRRSSGSSSSSSSSSSDESSYGGRHHYNHRRRLAPYDLATPVLMPRATATPVTPFVVQPFMA